MFTGIIESVCRVVSASRQSGGMRLEIDLGQIVKSGESVAVNGVCLTVSNLKGNSAQFDVSGETMTKTTIGNLKTGSSVNIERAMSANDRFGGHFVQGHIDAIGKIKKIERQGDFWRFVFEGPKDILDYIIAKGSIAIDGVSLTIADVEKDNFSAAIIPATFENTIFKNYRLGDSVNIETDIICRIVKKQIEKILPDKSNLTIDKLKEMGF
ncbi:MAG: riboflavin synthase [Planctomycetes bacterium HGW-Planctomycetes-1]|nr:MAG: riboflavin synthase [Planctomycetes bacterium HGW-Planctomycetes-1]